MKKIILYLFCYCPFLIMAQSKQTKKSFKEEVFTQHVIRRVLIDDTFHSYYNNLSKLTTIGDTSIAEMLIKKVLMGKITAYSKVGDNTLVPIDINEIRILVATQFDTMEVRDPVTEKLSRHIAERTFPYASIQNCKLLEEWVYREADGTTTVKVKAIGLLKDEYDANAQLMGEREMLWLKYNDVADVLLKYYQQHPLCNLSTSLWLSYFTENYHDGRRIE